MMPCRTPIAAAALLALVSGSPATSTQRPAAVLAFDAAVSPIAFAAG